MYLFSNNFKKQERNDLAVTEAKKFINLDYTKVLWKPFLDGSITTLQRELLTASDKITQEYR